MSAVLPLRPTGVTRECWTWPNRVRPSLIPSLIHLRSRGFAWALAAPPTWSRTSVAHDERGPTDLESVLGAGVAHDPLGS